MVSLPFDPAAGRTALAETLRAVRRLRGLNQTQMGAAMGISRRSYQQMESATGRPTVEQLAAFSHATDSDLMVLVAAFQLATPDLAVRAAENKMLTILAIAAADHSEAVGDAASALLPHDLMAAARSVFAALHSALEKRLHEEARLADRMRRPPDRS